MFQVRSAMAVFAAFGIGGGHIITNVAVSNGGVGHVRIQFHAFCVQRIAGYVGIGLAVDRNRAKGPAACSCDVVATT